MGPAPNCSFASGCQRSTLRGHVIGTQVRFAFSVQPGKRSRYDLVPRRQLRFTALNAAGGTKQISGPGGLFAAAAGTMKLRMGGGPTDAKQASTRSPGGKSNKDNGTVFVAGSTGRLGVRIVRELLRSGFKVRAGVRKLDAAKQTLDVAIAYGLLSAEEAARVQLVEFNLEKPDSLEPALGNAAKVVCTVGAAEAEILNANGPRKVDGEGTISLVEAAAKAGVQQFILVTSLGTGKFGWPAGVLNLFWGVLLWKRRAEEALEQSGMAYCIVRPGGMERPTDEFKRTNNVRLAAKRDTLFGGVVSRLQVAELVAAACMSPELAENKVLEVVAETTAPLLSYEELLGGVESEINRELQLERKEAEMAALAELEAAQGVVQGAQAAFVAADAAAKEAEKKLKEVQAELSATKKDASATLAEGAAVEKAVEKARERAANATRVEAASRAVVEAAKKAAAAGELLSKEEQKAIFKSVMEPQVEKPKVVAAPAPLFGGFGTKKAAPEPVPEPEVAAPPAAKPSFFGGFGAKKAAAEPAPEPEAAAPEPPSKPAPVPFFGGFLSKKQPEAAAEPEPEPTPEPVPEPPKKSSGFSFFGLGQQAVQLGVGASPAPPVVPDKVEAPKAAPVVQRASARVAPKAVEAAPAPEPVQGMKMSVVEAAKAKLGGTAVASPQVDAKAAAAAKAASAKARAEEAAKAQAEVAAAAKAKADEAARAEVAAKLANQKKADEANAAATKAAEAAAAEAAKKKAEVAAKAEAASKAEAEAKAKADAAAKAEAEAKAKAEAEAKAKADAAARAKAEADAVVAAKKAEEERLKKLREQEEIERRVLEETMAAQAAEQAAKKKAEEAARRRALEEEAARKKAEMEALARAEAEAKAAAVAAAKATLAAVGVTAAAPAAVPANVAEARKWIAAWKQAQAAPAAPAAAAKAAAPKPAAPKVDAPKVAAAPAPAVVQAEVENPMANMLKGFRWPWEKQEETPAPAPAPTPAVPENVAEARAWIAAWKAKQASASSSNGTSAPKQDKDVPPNVAEAREWIRRWRIQQLEKSLGATTSAKK